ncbi:MAG TPA: sugar phosphate nucleotidyltransferase [Longimicrobiales bacterium]
MADRFDGMIFAAGLGTRLRPLTNTIPKALVPVAGVAMLERVARRLIDAGADRLVINAHHHADQIARFIDERDGFGVECRLSIEEGEPLETGGGLLRAHQLGYFRGDRPIVVHNADVFTDFPIDTLLESHRASDALATLAVMDRDKSRALIFDDDGLCGAVGRDGSVTMARAPHGELAHLGYCGVHACSPELLERITETGVFSIVWPWLRLAGAGARVAAHRVDGARWIDIGSPEKLAEANAALAG